VSDAATRPSPAAAEPRIVSAPDPALPGWWTWDLVEPGRFNAVLGRLWLRDQPDGRVRLRMVPARAHTNLSGALHGGLIAGFADVALFATGQMRCRGDVFGGATIDLSLQYLAAGRADLPLEGVGELLRETGRMAFVRGLIVQGEADAHRVAAFSGTIRKVSAGSAA
jgi:uncharacterized protein (TIGR00369 family)